MPSVFFYISGHGYGHAVRQIEIINTLGRLAHRPLPIVVRTGASRWLFDRTLRVPVTFLPAQTDTGVVQIDGLRLDEAETMRQAAAFYDTMPRRVEEEAELLRAHDAAIVISDAPPLGPAAAAAAGIPGVVCANFTWDWIYTAYAGDTPATQAVLASIRTAYAAAEGWRMPFHGGFETLAAVSDIPLVARHAQDHLTHAAVRSRLGLGLEAKLLLVSFGGFGVRDLPLDRLDCLKGWQVIVTTRGERPALPAGVHAVEEADLYGAALRYEDLVGAVDVVLTKPGYGIVSDCIANGTAVLYTSRGRFPEYDVLVAEMPRYLRCRFIEMDRFLGGRWQAGLDALDETAAPPERLRTDGATVVARRILSRL